MKTIKELFSEYLPEVAVEDGDTIDLGTSNGWDEKLVTLHRSLDNYLKEVMAETRLARCWNRYWIHYSDGETSITLIYDVDSSD